jgi:urease accessory protein
MSRSLSVSAVASGLATLALPSLALAHHPMGGKTPATLFEGFMSGLAHPVIGPDHLAMILLVGAYCGVTRRGLAPAAAFVGTGLVGCVLHAARIDLPMAEAFLAGSLVLAGLLAWVVAQKPHALATALLGATGVLHGYAYGESIVGAESSPLLAYLLGFSLVQLAIAALVFWLTRSASSSRQVVLVRALGGVSAAIGLVALV